NPTSATDPSGHRTVFPVDAPGAEQGQLSETGVGGGEVLFQMALATFAAIAWLAQGPVDPAWNSYTRYGRTIAGYNALRMPTTSGPDELTRAGARYSCGGDEAPWNARTAPRSSTGGDDTPPTPQTQGGDGDGTLTPEPEPQPSTAGAMKGGGNHRCG